MANKRVVRLAVADRQHNVESFIPTGIIDGTRSGPTLAVIGGVHGTEYAAHDGVLRFWESLDPSKLSGRVMVVLAADVVAMCAHSAYVNPVDGKNLNRVWPGNKEGTLTEAIAHTITQKVVSQADAVLDCHGGEFDEAIDLFAITHATDNADLNRRALELAMALGLPFVEVTGADGAVLGAGTGSGEAMRMGKPAATLEAGGLALRDERHVAGTFAALHNALRHLGIVSDAPIPWAGRPVKLDHGILLKSRFMGLLLPQVSVGTWIAKNECFARVVDFDGAVLEEVLAPEAGVVLDVIVGRAVKAGGFVGKIGVF